MSLRATPCRETLHETLHVYCIEGCHGVGKTKFIDYLKSQGQSVLDEEFMNNNHSSDLHPQCFAMEMIWMAEWIKNIISLVSVEELSGILFTDRSPYSAIPYAPHGGLMKETIDAALSDLHAIGIQFTFVHIQAPRDVIWNRIQDRLKDNPERMFLQENSEERLDSTLEFYNNMQWDIELQSEKISDMYAKLMSKIQ